MHVKDVVTGKDMEDEVNWCKFGSMVWEEHGRGFFYSAFPAPEKLEVKRKHSAGRPLSLSCGAGLIHACKAPQRRCRRSTPSAPVSQPSSLSKLVGARVVLLAVMKLARHACCVPSVLRLERSRDSVLDERGPWR